ncbi:DUF6233 domain-containing protein [Streptomyces sp900116325]|uniref:DUF6233 domain-containing protein n=1 Tax=Streptomyces sp. 900116325 TaxID=3154295 RepID=UPI0033AC3660
MGQLNAKITRPRTGSLSSASGSVPGNIGIHVGGCYTAGNRRLGVTREQALAALAHGIRTCIHCRPDTELGLG